MNTDGSQGGVVPIFATPFASVDTGTGNDFNDRLARLYDARREQAESQAGLAHDPLHYRGPANLLDDDDGPAGRLKEVILGHASRTVASITRFTSEETANLRIDARAWCSIVQPGGHIPVQHFSGASWLAVYCVQAGQAEDGARDAGILRLHETRLSSIFRDASSWESQSPYRYGHYSWTPAPGRMALFPAHVRHEISVVRSATALVLVFALLRFLEAGVTDNRYG